MTDVDDSNDPNCACAFEAWRSAREEQASHLSRRLSALCECLLARAGPQATYWASAVGTVQADDLLHTAWARFQEQLERDSGPPGPGYPGSLFHRILRNHALDLIRGQRLRATREAPDDGGAAPGEGPAAPGIRAEDRERVRTTIARMARSRRKADRVGADLLRSHYLDGRSAPEIAATLGSTPGAVEQALRRARIDFIKALRAGGGEGGP